MSQTLNLNRLSACSRDSRPRDWSRLGFILLVSVSPIISRDSRDWGQLYFTKIKGMKRAYWGICKMKKLRKIIHLQMTFLSIDQCYIKLTLIRDDFAASQINLDFLSYQKNPRVMPSILRKLFDAALNQKELLVWRDSILQKFKCSSGDQSINALVFLKHIFQKEEQELVSSTLCQKFL